MKNLQRIIGITALGLFVWLGVSSYQKAMACDPLCMLIKKSERELEEHKEMVNGKIVELYGAKNE